MEKSQPLWVRLLCYTILIIGGASMLFPLSWMIITSLRPEGSSVMELSLNFKPHWENYRTAWSQTHFDRALFNSALVTLCVTVAQVLTSALAAFAFARLKFFGRDKIFMGYLATMMVPEAITMIPLFILFRTMGLIDTYWALILPAAFSAYGTFMLRQFFLGIPRELEEAATIDGCNSLGIFRHVVLPLSKPALAALAILTFMGSWRSFMWPLIVSQSPSLFTLPVALSQFQDLYGVQWALLMAGSAIMILPMLIIFIVGQRYFISGIQLGAVKG
ncbi:MAG: carbohydrate ABC transporter permease [Phycisphaerales bacterium]|nr:carbohydrate ABC transporter permease [Phycisphaerales bacterium]